ncbi:hypothetical protein ABID26_007179 [Mesorhizobium shonense]|uniref:Uncharacterized protein n=1 Tax=Mesorhizobium shonense TaxID=1209948 RepID=A0ABV2I5I1_9HYPH
MDEADRAYSTFVFLNCWQGQVGKESLDHPAP